MNVENFSPQYLHEVLSRVPHVLICLARPLLVLYVFPHVSHCGSEGVGCIGSLFESSIICDVLLRNLTVRKRNLLNLLLLGGQTYSSEVVVRDNLKISLFHTVSYSSPDFMF